MENAKIKAIGEYVVLEKLPQKGVLVGADHEALRVVSIGDHVSASVILIQGDTVLVRPGSAEPISVDGSSYLYVAATDIVCRVNFDA